MKTEKPIYHEKKEFIRPGYDGRFRTGGFSRPEIKYYESELLVADAKEFVRYCTEIGQHDPRCSTPSMRVRAGAIMNNYGAMHGYREPRHRYEDSQNKKALRKVAGM